ncbi:MAG TPA: SDR family oxidoreductase [Acidimicrobiales bacterium]|jgi:NAD(P)-dependent dehydrogenase (short-subunit alcohol dehydrogenase family)|nr:SDR family oxidoreductase [Acidimicrobiales bacterium]
MGGELDGKVAIVTGGASGIGRAIVELFAKESASVVIADVNADAGEDVATALGDTVAFKRTDVSSADDVRALVDFTVERFGGLQVMVNNAGIGGSNRLFLKDDFRDFEQVMGVNLLGVMLGTQAAARHMADHGGGAVVNTTSIGGINPGAGFTAYRAAKAAVIHLTKSTAIELAENDIRVNCLAPAHIATPINAFYDVSQIVVRMQPLQRQGRPNDVAEAALFLASERAAQITGVVLPVDGGTTAGPPAREANAIARAAMKDAEQ